MDIFETLVSKVSAEWVAIAISVLSVLTSLTISGAALWYSRRQARAAEKQLAVAQQVQRENSEPYVVVDIRFYESHYPMMMLVVENVGPTVARDVKITFDPPLRSSLEDNEGEQKMADLYILKNGIPMLPPGRKIETFFDSGFSRFKDGSEFPNRYFVGVEAKGPYGPVEPMKYVIDLEIFSDTSTIRDNDAKKVVSALGKIEKAVKEIKSRSR